MKNSGSASPGETKEALTALITAVHLGHECPKAVRRGSKVSSKRDTTKESQEEAERDTAESKRDSDAQPASLYGPLCDHTSVQLIVNSLEQGAPWKFRIVDAELVDHQTQKSLGHLKASEPKMWNLAYYVAWNGLVPAKEQLQVMYKLSAPKWALVGGRWNARTRDFVLRLKIKATRGKQLLVIKAESFATMMEPPVET